VAGEEFIWMASLMAGRISRRVVLTPDALMY
jgi:hypothetical protein